MSKNLSLPWPPSYTIKRHPRAKNVRLRASANRGLEITLPTRFNIKHIPQVIEANKSWILKQLAKYPPLPAEPTLPNNITIFDDVWPIEYVATHTRWMIYQRPTQVVVVAGNIEDQALCQKKFISWLKEKARIMLLMHLQQVSDETKISYRSAQVRAQQTLWGSCTRDHAISLNYRLIFFPFAVARYVMVHELCHTKILNHSPAFWDMVSLYDPAWKTHRKLLRQSASYIPPWAL